MKCYNCGKTGHSLRNCRKPRDDNRIMTARLRDILRHTPQEEKVTMLKKLISEQAAHINFLSEHLYDRITDEMASDEDVSEDDGSGSDESKQSLHSGSDDGDDEILTYFTRTLGTEAGDSLTLRRDNGVRARVKKAKQVGGSRRKCRDDRAMNTAPYQINLTSTRRKSDKNKFAGACIDIGAQMSCIGLKQARAYAAAFGTKL